MKIKILLKTVIFLWSLVQVLSGPLGLMSTPVASNQQIHYPSQLLDQVENWKKGLSSTEHFEEWDNAQYNISPLGPGTHSWIVTITNKDQEIGYMIIYATEDGQYQLGEYGYGPFANSLSIQNEAQQMYYADPLHAVIVNKDSISQWLTGEILPIEIDDVKKYNDKQSKRHGLVQNHVSVKNERLHSYFSPYDRLPWIQGKPLSITDASSILSQFSNEKELRFTSRIWEQQIMQAWSLLGYHQWNDTDQTIYIAVTDESEQAIRYIPLLYLIDQGHIYSSNK